MRHTFDSLCYGPDLPKSGQRLHVEIDQGHLTLKRMDGLLHRVPLAQLRVLAGGQDDRVWRFEWEDGSARWAATLDDPRVQGALLATPPAPLAAALTALIKQHRGKSWRLTEASLLGLSIVLPLLLLLGFLVWAGTITSWLVSAVPVSTEQKLGELAWKAQKTGLKLIENTAANAAVEAIGGKLTQGSAYRYRWFVAQESSINAFAIPGGTVVVHSALIEAAKTPEELAGVLAHEVQHVEQRHSLRAIAQSLGTLAAVGLVFGDVSGIAQIAASLSQLSYSRDAEREADTKGIAALQAARIDPQGMVRMFETLGKESEGIKPPAMLSSHPATAERIARLKTAIAEAGSWPVQSLALDWAVVQASIR